MIDPGEIPVANSSMKFIIDPGNLPPIERDPGDLPVIP